MPIYVHEAATLRRASHLSSEHLQTASLWVGSGSRECECVWEKGRGVKRVSIVKV